MKQSICVMRTAFRPHRSTGSYSICCTAVNGQKVSVSKSGYVSRRFDGALPGRITASLGVERGAVDLGFRETETHQADFWREFWFAHSGRVVGAP